MDLVLKEWWTDTTLTTDAAGTCNARGFLGDYQITVTSGARQKSIQANSSEGRALVIELH